MNPSRFSSLWPSETWSLSASTTVSGHRTIQSAAKSPRALMVCCRCCCCRRRRRHRCCRRGTKNITTVLDVSDDQVDEQIEVLSKVTDCLAKHYRYWSTLHPGKRVSAYPSRVVEKYPSAFGGCSSYIGLYSPNRQPAYRTRILKKYPATSKNE